MNKECCGKTYTSTSGWSYHRRKVHGEGKPFKDTIPPDEKTTVIGSEPVKVVVTIRGGGQEHHFVTYAFSFADARDAVAGGLRQALPKGR